MSKEKGKVDLFVRGPDGSYLPGVMVMAESRRE